MAGKSLKPLFLLTTMLMVTFVGSVFLVQRAGAVSPNPNARNVTFYFHYQGTPVFVGGTMSHYLTNTTRRFQATNNSVVKAISQPKIELDFFMYPSLAGPVSFNGTWQVIVWANASALKPTVWNTEYQEVTPGGAIAWDSGALTATVVGGPATNNGYLDVPVYAYNLSDANLAHTFTSGNSVRVAVSANPGSTVTARFWYDSVSFPSQAIFPAIPVAQPAEIWTEDSTGFATSAFQATAGLKVLANANVTDPFGGYDINATAIGSKSTMATLTVTAPDATTIVSNQRMTLLSGGPLSLENILQYNITISSGMPGQYSVLVSSTDHSGNVEQLTFTFTLGQTHKFGVYVLDGENRPLAGSVVTVWQGSFQIFGGIASAAGTVNGTMPSANYTLRVSWQAVTVYQAPLNFAGDTSLTLVTTVYDTTIILVDDTGSPLSGALVSITHPNGTEMPGLITTGATGNISLTRAPAGSWGLTVLWKTVNVFTGTVQVSSSGPYTVKTQVYQYKVTVDDKNGSPVRGAYVVLYNSYGVVYDFKSTDASGSVTLKVPIGTYTIVGLYSTTYFYTPVSASANKTSVSINASGSTTLTLSDYPPSILSTSGFDLIVLGIVGIVGGVLVTFFIMKKRAPKILNK